MKIALRKKKTDKIDKYQSKIKELHLSLNIPEGTGLDRKIDVKSGIFNELDDDRKEREKDTEKSDKETSVAEMIWKVLLIRV